jgi:pSer/pThr/pTyr-binding forkhead associated (FHA) protein
MNYSETDQLLRIKILESASSFFEKEFAEGNEIKVGRSEHCDLVLRSKKISRNHCRFVYDNGWLIEDSGSQNGIRVNGQKVPSSRLTPGDEIQIGGYKIQVLPDPAMAAQQRDGQEDDDATVISSQENVLDETKVLDETIITSGPIHMAASSESGVKKIKTALLENKLLLTAAIGGGVVILVIIILALMPGSDSPPPAPEKAVVEQEIEKSKAMLDMESQHRLDYYLESGKEQLAEGNFNEALIRYQSAINIDPDNQEALAQIEVVNNKIIEAAEAKKQAEAEKREQEARVAALISKIEQAMGKSDYQKASELIAEAEFLSPGHPSVEDLKTKLDAASEQERKKKEELLSQQAELKKEAEQLFEKGQSHYNRKEYYKALTAWNAVLDLNVETPETDHIKNALPHVKKLLEDQVYGHYNSGKAHFQRKDYSKALASLQKVVLVNPVYKDTQILIKEASSKLEKQVKKLYQEGLVYEGIGQNDRAEKKWKEVLMLMPLESNTYYKKAYKKLQ